MPGTRLAVALAATLLVACSGGSGARRDAGSGDEALGQRVADYFRKATDTPGVTLQVTGLAPAEVPGWRKGVLQASLGEQKQEIPFTVSPDGRWLVRGEPIDLTLDPHEAVMRKIHLDDQPSRGPADARVTMVEWSDFECPYCGRAWEIVEQEVMKAYGDRIRFVFKQMPLTQIHPWAERAAMASECAFRQGNERFWALYDGLFRVQGTITAENFSTKLDEIAAAAALDVPRLHQCMDGQEALEAVRADVRDAQALGITATPSFVVNGRQVNGAQSADAFKQAIEQALAASNG